MRDLMSSSDWWIGATGAAWLHCKTKETVRRPKTFLAITTILCRPNLVYLFQTISIWKHRLCPNWPRRDMTGICVTKAARWATQTSTSDEHIKWAHRLNASAAWAHQMNASHVDVFLLFLFFALDPSSLWLALFVIASKNGFRKCLVR